jgi:hypothetical protein
MTLEDWALAVLLLAVLVLGLLLLRSRAQIQERTVASLTALRLVSHTWPLLYLITSSPHVTEKRAGEALTKRLEEIEEALLLHEAPEEAEAESDPAQRLEEGEPGGVETAREGAVRRG